MGRASFRTNAYGGVQGLTEPIAFFNERAKLKNSFYVKSCFSPCGRWPWVLVATNGGWR